MCMESFITHRNIVATCTSYSWLFYRYTDGHVWLCTCYLCSMYTASAQSSQQSKKGNRTSNGSSRTTWLPKVVSSCQIWPSFWQLKAFMGKGSNFGNHNLSRGLLLSKNDIWRDRPLFNSTLSFPS